ncbi:MAG: hypothetical protein O3A46_03045 [Candidatus Poribacteria bacterium]|nr:hypothetical protein [Candidatus Poribacteria bacterium]
MIGMRRNARLMLALFALGTMFWVVNDAEARRGFSGGSRGFSSGRSSSWGSSRSTATRTAPKPSSSATKSNAATSGTSTQKWGGSSNTNTLSGSRATATQNATAQRATGSTTSRTGNSTADRALYQRASANGTAFQSRDAAVSDFRAKNASQYGSQYASQPSSRPSHIPQSTTVDGRPVTINYNTTYGGYGYMMGGQWMMYNALADAAMLSVLMNNRGYYYGAPPMAYGGEMVPHHSYGSPFVSFIGSFIMFIFIVVAIVIVFRMGRRMIV